MATLASYLFDDQTLGVDFPAVAPWNVAGTGQFPVSTAAARHGARGARLTSSSGYRHLEYRPGSDTSALRVMDMYIKPGPFTTSPVPISFKTDANVAVAEVRLNAAGTVSVRNGTTVAATSTGTIALDGSTWYRLAYGVWSSNQELRVYEGESTTPLFTVTAAVTETQWGRFNAGLCAAQNGTTYDIDTVRFGDDWFAPFGEPEEPLDTPTGFTFTALSGSVGIDASCDAVAGASTYSLEVEEGPSNDWTPLGTFTQSARTWQLRGAQGIQPGTEYRGRVRANPAGV